MYNKLNKIDEINKYLNGFTALNNLLLGTSSNDILLLKFTNMHW